MRADQGSDAPNLLLRGLKAWDTGQGLDLLLPWPDVERFAAGADEVQAWRRLGERAQGRTLAVDLTGALLAPGLVDPHVHFRDPGGTDKEDMITGCSAAAAGGYSSVLIMPNTQPAMDGPEVIGYLQGYESERGRRLPVGYRLCAAASRDREGLVPNPPSAWADYLPGGPVSQSDPNAALHPVVALSDDGAAVTDGIAEQVALSARAAGIPLLDHCERHRTGFINQGPVSRRLGLEGVPASTELAIVNRDIKLARTTGARIHLQHVSTAGAFQAIREAKRQGLPVSCETAPHYLALSDEDVPRLGAMGKMNPPLRSEADRQASLEAMADGTVDMIATDHAPHTRAEKERGLESAPNGVIGLESAYGVCHSVLVDGGWIDEARLIELMSLAPARLMGMASTDIGAIMHKVNGQRSQEGASAPVLDLTADAQAAQADLVVLAPEESWTVEANRFLSKARNTPFEGMTVSGRPLMTIVGGRPTHSVINPKAFKAVVAQAPRKNPEGRQSWTA
ncbi:dihydroorotase PyrC [Bifidobacterium actinocoloniiforme DSM 22766]|uniref:Dihydroorotase PyrC n=1 Tax=Bifidobacterium actinocoloniiforme DSM 22766 TaxID=1437605 RepID=A0A086Z0K5_9BIFI|nr:dihydroorotase [Bifidobacterium actinocoloniiforme]KFI40055.1 dihydroorotase PyrC [Bifidobacterium actinocoloniiforme DSM 22766]